MMLWRWISENKILNFLAWVWKSVKICFIPNSEVAYIEILLSAPSPPITFLDKVMLKVPYYINCQTIGFHPTL